MTTLAPPHCLAPGDALLEPGDEPEENRRGMEEVLVAALLDVREGLAQYATTTATVYSPRLGMYVGVLAVV